MTWLTILLSVIACVSNAIMDEIQFRWSRVFGRWFKPGSKLEKWFNPSVSWKNKYIFKSRVLNFLVESALVCVTDFWHFLKFVTINSVFGAFLSVLELPYWGALDYIVVMILLNLTWGVLFEFVNGIFGSISDFYNLKNK